MVRQLANRIFSTLSQDDVGTSSWRATKHYTEALRAFRKAKRDVSKGTVLLPQAERGFFQAYRYDNCFTRSRYNLGVIFHTQEQYKAAYEVFRRVIKDTSNSPPRSVIRRNANRLSQEFLSNVHYAAAKSAQSLLLELSAYHCDSAIRLNPWNNRAWYLKGKLRWRDVTQRPDKETRANFRRATALSWFSLCAAESKGKATSVPLSLAVTHLATFANSLRETRRAPRVMSQALRLDPLKAERRAPRVMSQALRLDPLKAENWFTLGELQLRAGEPQEAVKAFETANQIEEKPIYWLWVACTRRLNDEKEPRHEKQPHESAEYAWRRVTNYGRSDLFENDGISRFWETWQQTLKAGEIKLPDVKDWAEEAARMVAFLRDINRDINQERADIASGKKSVSQAIEEWRARLDKAECDPWSSAQILRWLATWHERGNNRDEAEKSRDQAIAWEKTNKFKYSQNVYAKADNLIGLIRRTEAEIAPGRKSVSDAIQEWTARLDKEGDPWFCAPILRWLAQLYEQDNKLEATRTTLDRASALENTDEYKYLNNKAVNRDALFSLIQQTKTNITSGKKSVSDAIQEWTARLDKEGDLWFCAQILTWLAQLYEQDNNPEAAQTTRDTASALEKTDKYRYLQNKAAGIINLLTSIDQARTEVASGVKSVSDAIHEWTARLDNEGDPWFSAQILRLLADLYEKDNNHGDSKKTLDRVLELEKTSAFNLFQNDIFRMRNLIGLIEQTGTMITSNKKTLSDAIEEWTTQLKRVEGDAWSCAQISCRLADLYLDNNGEAARENLEKAIAWLESNHEMEVATTGLSYGLAGVALKDYEDPRQINPEKRDSALLRVTEALARNPNEGLARSLLVKAYLWLALPGLAGDQLENALSLAPNDQYIRRMAADVALKILDTVTEPKLRRDALQRIVVYFTDQVAYCGQNVWSLDLEKIHQQRGNLGWAHFWLAFFSFQSSLDFTTAQSGYETAYACSYRPIQSLVKLCELYFRGGAFDEAERTYRRLKKLVPGEADDQSPLLSLTDDLRQLDEQKPPAFGLAWASIHTAAAMAEQGSTRSMAMERYRVARKWRLQLKRALKAHPADKQSLTADDLQLLTTRMFLAKGIILLGCTRGLYLAPDSRMRQLRCAANHFTRALQLGTDMSARADALFRKAKAFAELAKLDTEYKKHWQDCAAETLTLADTADRAGEYKERIEQLRQMLGLSASKSLAKDSASTAKADSAPKPKESTKKKTTAPARDEGTDAATSDEQ